MTDLTPAETLRAAAARLREGKEEVQPDLTVDFPDLNVVQAALLENYASFLDRDPEFESPSLTAALAIARAVLGVAR